MKKLITACVATLAFITMQSSMVMAMENEAVATEENVILVDKIEENPDKQINLEIIKENADNYTISNEERNLLAQLVEAEAKGESYEGKVAVATVVLNRVESPQFPDTVTDVIYEVVGNAYAFSPVQNGEINNTASEETKEAVEDALVSTDRLSNAVYFYNQEIATDEWIRTREIVKTIDHHVFAI